MTKGKYIVIEGAEGVGKTTMVQKVADALQKAGLSVRVMREPDSQNDLTARAIRHLTQDPRYPMNTRTEVLLYNAARSQSLETIRTARDNGVVCLVDRSYLTTLAIQYYGRGDVQDYVKINEIIEFAVGDMQPDLMLVLDAPVETLKNRTKHRYSGDRFDSLDEAFLERVRAGYLWEARQRNLPVVYATGDIDDVFKQVWAHVTATLADRGQKTPASKPSSVAEVIAKKQVTKTAAAAAETVALAQSIELQKAAAVKSTETEAASQVKPAESGSSAPTHKSIANMSDTYVLPADLPASLKKDFRQSFDAIADVRKSIASQLRTYAKDHLAGQDVGATIQQALATLPQQQLTIPPNHSQRFNKLAYEVLSSTHGDTTTEVTLVSYVPHNEFDSIADMLYSYSDMTKQGVTAALQKQSYDTKAAVFDAYCESGEVDAFQNTTYEFDILSSGVSFAEIANANIFQHVTAQQPTPRYGYETPAIIEAAGLSETYATCFDISLQLYSIIQKLGDSHVAAAATLLGHRLRWKATLRADKLKPLAELAATSSPATQQLIRSIIEQVGSVHPLTAAHLTKLS